jgi:NADH-quinone oxidoreductase subunit H
MDANIVLVTSTVAKMLFVVAICLGMVPFIVWFERRGAAWFQGRIGPNRVGPLGLLQPLADVLKFFFKESWYPAHAHKFYYHLAPIVALVAPLAALSAIPFGSHLAINGFIIPLQIASVDAGVIFILAFAGLEVYPVILAGWSSNNKYAILGALRGTSQVVSYEIAMGLALLSMLLVYGSFDLNDMVRWQAHPLLGIIPSWGVFLNPLAALIFWISIFAETNRLPFDLPEGESELVAGYHLEYGAIKFAAFFMAEYVAMIMASALLATVFFGGYGMLPGMGWAVEMISGQAGLGAEGVQNLTALMEFTSIFLKVTFFMFVFVWVRWTLPRFRFDQLMDLGWKWLFPLSLANLVYTAWLSWWLAR